MIKIVPIDTVKASEYNPRKNDEKRLALVELSLRKLGFLLPIVADKGGEILSGHQRHYVARKMGFTKVPVQYIDCPELEKRKNINIMFNRATNDLRKNDTCKKIKDKLYHLDVSELTQDIHDVEIDSKESFPCVYSVKRFDTVSLAKQNADKFNSYMAALAKSLEYAIKDSMQIVVDVDGNVVNGVGRIQIAAEKKKPFIQCVVIPREKKEFATNMLNLLSMDFSVEGSYADVLRYNSFMRSRNTRETDEQGRCALGDGFFKGVFPKNNGRDFFALEGKPLEIWKKHYGDKIVDFGAGKLNNTRTLRQAGIFVSAFEPYFVGAGDKVYKAKSIEIAKKFLNEVESGVEYTSVFISSVFNSVPFIEDRIKIAIIAAALCKPRGKVVCWCQSDESHQFVLTKKRHAKDEKGLTFDLDYEPNIVLGDLRQHPKVQKGHTEEELRRIFGKSFLKVDRLEQISKFWYLEASQPIISLESLAEALDFEFELPYPDGTTLGLSQKAREAFEKRLGVHLPERKSHE